MFRLKTTAALVALVAALSVSPAASASMIGDLQTPAASGVVGGGQWSPPAGGSGYLVSWIVTQNFDNTWNYEYTFLTESGKPLTPLTSHVIFQLSETATPSDLFNFTGDIQDVEYGTFGPSTGNPGFPVGETTFGIKINLGFDQKTIAFDSTRAPMWGDFYSKAGGTGNPSYAYNVHLGTTVSNPHDIDGVPVDGNGNPLHKIVVPNTIPEPSTIALLLLPAAALLSRGRRNIR